MRLAVPGAIRDFDCNLAALFEVNAACTGCDTSCTTTDRRCYLLAIDRKPAESRGANAEQEVARFRGCQGPGPPHAEGFLPGDFFREIGFGELYVRLRTANKRRRRRSLAGFPSAHAFVVVGLKSRLAIWSGQKTIRYRRSIRAKELRSGNEGDIRTGKLSVEPIEDGDDMSGLTRIVPKQGPGLIGKRPNHGDLADPRL